MKTKKFIAFIAAVVITAGAITTGTILLLRQPDKKPSGALTPADLMKPVSQIPAHLLPSASSAIKYTVPYSHYIEFGEYPQTHVNDTTLINDLNANAIPTGHQYLVNGNAHITQTWAALLLPEYALNNVKYVKILEPKPHSTYTMSTDTIISTSIVDLWFKVEPLLWFVTNKSSVDGGAGIMNLLAVNEVIAGIPFHNIGTTTYYDSGIRAFLNGVDGQIANTADGMSIPANLGFLQTAFNPMAQDLIKPINIDNKTDASNMTSPYTDANDYYTADKIYPPSYNDMTTAPFETSTSSGTGALRKSKPTDFALVNYAYYSSTYTAGYHWLRSAYSSTDGWNVGFGGSLNHDSIRNANVGLRPTMQIAVSMLALVGSVDALVREPVVANRIAALEAEVAQLKADRATMQGKIAALETAKGTIESNISTLQTNLGKAQSDITGLQTQLNNAKTDLEAKITAAKNAATAAAKEALDAEVEILESKISGLQSRIGELESAKATMKNEIAALQQADIDLQSQIAQIESDINDSINIQITALTKQLTDYMEAHANDYKYGYDDGYMAYVNEYAFVTWKILQGNDYIAGPVTTYTLHKKVNTPYGTEIQPLTLPPELQTVSSKQYTYTFAHWSLSPQTGEHPNPKADLPKKRDATDVIYYAQYERAEREYTVTWIIPDDRLDYTNATKIQVTYKYGDAITSLALTEIHGAGVNYLPNGWAATQGGAKITDFGKCMGGRTFYARYTPKQTV